MFVVEALYQGRAVTVRPKMDYRDREQEERKERVTHYWS